MYRKICYSGTLCISGSSTGIRKMFKFNVKVFYVTGRVLSGELFCMQTVLFFSEEVMGFGIGRRFIREGCF